MSRFIAVLATLTLATSAYAVSPEGEHHGIPWKLILTQTFNFSLVVVGLIFLLRKKVRAHFLERKHQFKKLVQRAEDARQEAEQNKREVTERLQKLEGSAEESVRRAKSEAEELKAKIVEEARTLSEKLKEEAARTADFELERAKLLLRQELLNEAMRAAKVELNASVDESEQKRLQSEFVEKVQVVQ